MVWNSSDLGVDSLTQPKTAPVCTAWYGLTSTPQNWVHAAAECDDMLSSQVLH